MGKIEAILFDMDGVLVDSLDAHYAWLASFIEDYGYAKPKKEDYVPLFGLDRRGKIKSLTGERSEEKLDRMMDVARSKEGGFPTELMKLPAGENEVLETLSKRYKLGIVTSGTVRSVERFFTLAGTKKYFAIAVAREDYKTPKPNPESLLLALKKMGVRPENATYIGDSKVDVIAGHAAGVQVVAYPNSIEGADASTSRFDTIPAAIEKLEMD